MSPSQLCQAVSCWSISRRISNVELRASCKGVQPWEALSDGIQSHPTGDPSFSPSPIPLLQLPQRVYSMPDTTLSAGETGMNKTDVAHALWQSCSIRLFMQQTLIEHLLRARHGSRCQGARSEPTKQKSLPPRSSHSR